MWMRLWWWWRRRARTTNGHPLEVHYSKLYFFGDRRGGATATWPWFSVAEENTQLLLFFFPWLFFLSLSLSLSLCLCLTSWPVAPWPLHVWWILSNWPIALHCLLNENVTGRLLCSLLFFIWLFFSLFFRFSFAPLFFLNFFLNSQWDRSRGPVGWDQSGKRNAWKDWRDDEELWGHRKFNVKVSVFFVSLLFCCSWVVVMIWFTSRGIDLGEISSLYFFVVMSPRCHLCEIWWSQTNW